jgi:uncharacterized protein YcbK (DUF882 family)
MGIRPSSALFAAFTAGLAFASGPGLAHADVQHTIARGHTLEAIAARYRVPAKTIIEANKLKDPDRLRAGDVLTIPKVDAPKSTKGDKNAKKDFRTAKLEVHKAGSKGKPKEPPSYEQKPKTPGVVHIRRIATTEERDIRVVDERGRVSSAAVSTFEKLLRSPSGLSHPIDARLVSLLAVVSNHFGSRKIEVVSGFRPYTQTQYTKESNHNHGKAIDFRVVGVPNDVVRDFCRTLKKVGCGYYPHSSFVHMDVRETSAFWIDYSKPGEPPRYNAPNLDPDEGASDVHDEMHAATGATPTDAPPPTIT